MNQQVIENNILKALCEKKKVQVLQKIKVYSDECLNLYGKTLTLSRRVPFIEEKLFDGVKEIWVYDKQIKVKENIERGFIRGPGLLVKAQYLLYKGEDYYFLV